MFYALGAVAQREGCCGVLFHLVLSCWQPELSGFTGDATCAVVLDLVFGMQLGRACIRVCQEKKKPFLKPPIWCCDEPPSLWVRVDHVILRMRI